MTIGPRARPRSSPAAAISTLAPPSAASGTITGWLPSRLTSPASAARTAPAVDRHQLVSKQRRRLGPDEHVADPAAIAALPLGPQSRNLTVNGADRSLERAELVADPAPAAEHGTEEDDDHDQIDPEHGEQRDNHAAMLAHWPGLRITHQG